MKYTDLNKTKYQSLHLFNDNIKLKNSINKSANELLNENFNIPMLHKLLKDKKYFALKKISSEFNKIYNQYSQNKIGYITDFNKYISSLRKQIKKTNIPQINEQKIIKKVITKFNEITSDIPTYDNLLDNIINETMAYTGSPNNFNKFSLSHLRWNNTHGFGIYVAKNKDIAIYYARKYGIIYTVEIPDDNYFLNENIELFNQSKYVQEKLSKIFVYLYKSKKYNDYVIDNFADDDTGKEIYDNIRDTLETQIKASMLLLKFGIKGIKFYDNDLGQCYVIFNPNDIKIIKKQTQLQIKKELKKQTNEAYDEISNNFYATKSVYDVERFLKSLNASKPTLRLLYDKSVKLWLADFGDTLIHFNMLRAAYKAGFYPQFRNQYEFENYINEDEWLDEPNMYRFKAYYNSENIKELINQEKADGYNTAYQYDTFTIIARSDVDLPETPLFKKLGKPNDTILLNENKILTENETNLNDNFWKWFRDSKVKNIEGKPLVMYHRTNSDLFDIFDIKKSHPQNLYGQGFYFSGIDMPSYGKNVLKCYLSIQNPFEAHKIKYNKKLFSKYFSKKELDIIFENETELYGSAILLSILDNQDKKLINSINIRDMLIDMGYDGIHKLYYWVAFQPNQIKSIDNNGEWNPNSNNIMENINEEKIIAYHGSKSSFNNFDVNKQKTNKFGKGFYFTNDKNEAKEYGDNIIKVNLTMNNPLYLKDAYFANDELLNNIGIKKFDHLDSQDSQNKIKAAGYDSIIVNNVDGKKDLKYYIVFEPKQIEIVKNNLKENITLPIYRTGKQFSIIGYHGSPNQFTTFKPSSNSENAYGKGIYFYPRKTAVKDFMDAEGYNKWNLYTCKVSFKNPIVSDSYIANWEKDYDGLIIQDEYTVWEIIARDPEQVNIIKMEQEYNKIYENKALSENKAILSDNFWKWFGNSKMIKNGEPMIFYHGTPNKFTTFDINKTSPYGTVGQGFYFTDSHKTAENYLGGILNRKTENSHIKSCYLKMENPYNLSDIIIEEEILNLSQYINANNDDFWYKKILDDSEKIYDEKEYPKGFMFEEGFYVNPKSFNKKMLQNAINWLYKEKILDNNLLNRDNVWFIMTDGFNTNSSKRALQKWLTQNGYDSVIYAIQGDNKGNGDWSNNVYVVFNPNQIKSINNKGLYSLENNDINESKLMKTNNPITLIGYHGTPNDFDNFDIKYSKDGIYFAPKNRLYSLASYYAKENGYIIKAKITLNNPFVGSPKEFQELYNKHYNEMKEKYDGVISVSDGSFPFNSKYFNYKTHKNEEEILNKGDIVEIVVFNPKQIQIISKQKLNSEQLEEEKIKLPKLEIGDKIKIGKYRNKKATIKDYFIDKDGQPNIKTNKGDRKLFNFKLEESKININPKNKKFIKI